MPNYVIFRQEFPAIFRVNGVWYMEDYGIDEETKGFSEINQELAWPWLSDLAIRPQIVRGE